MTIASELEDLASNLQAAKSAIVALGGTVGDTGLAGLASEIRTIPVEPGPEPEPTPYGVQDVNATGSVVNHTHYYTSLDDPTMLVDINAGTPIWVIAEWDDGTTNPPLSRYYQFSWAEGGIVEGYVPIADVVIDEPVPPGPEPPEPEPEQPFVVDAEGITNNFAEVYSTYSTDFPSGVILELGHMVYVPTGITAGGTTFYEVMEIDRVSYLGYVLADCVDIMNVQEPGEPDPGQEPDPGMQEPDPGIQEPSGEPDPGMEEPVVQEPVDPGIEDPNLGEGEQENPEPEIVPEVEPEP